MKTKVVRFNPKTGAGWVERADLERFAQSVVDYIGIGGIFSYARDEKFEGYVPKWVHYQLYPVMGPYLFNTQLMTVHFALKDTEDNVVIGSPLHLGGFNVSRKKGDIEVQYFGRQGQIISLDILSVGHR